jgi:D-glycerate 3-kinase
MATPRTSAPKAAVRQAAPASELVDYISSGPLVGSCGISADAVRANAAEWERLGRQLAVQLSFEHDKMDPVQK